MDVCMYVRMMIVCTVGLAVLRAFESILKSNDASKTRYEIQVLEKQASYGGQWYDRINESMSE